ncbi:MAG: SpoIID/LytB domain-containing protein [Patescibacteria group bacterium]
MKRFLSYITIFSLLLGVFPLGAVATDAPFTALIIKWSQRSADSELFVRTHEVSGAWSDWYDIEEDPDSDEREGAETSGPEVFFTVNKSDEHEYKVSGTIDGLTIERFSYGKEKNISSRLMAGLAIPGSLRIIRRTEWGANPELLYNDRVMSEVSQSDGNGDSAAKSENGEVDEIERVVTNDPYGRPYLWPIQYAKDVKFIVIHHTASVKNLDNPEVAIQNIYNYHSVGRRWGDIGYNYIIDQHGNIYEGRQGGDRVIGGHALPLNKVSVGIAVLGDFQEEEIPAPVMRSLLALTSSLAKKYKINSEGSTTYKDVVYKNINGHRDSDNTTCPGNFLYQKLIGTRELLNYHLSRRFTPINVPYSASDAFKRDVIFLTPDGEDTFTVRLKNNGTETWNTGLSLVLTKPQVATEFETIAFTVKPNAPTVVAQLKTASVAPGGFGVFEGKIASGLKSGLVAYDVVLQDSNGNRSSQSLPVAFMVQGVDGSYQVVNQHDPKSELKPGEETEGWVEIKNTGNVTWRNSGDHAIRIHPDSPRDRISKFFQSITLEQSEVKPGAVGKFTFKIKAPQTGQAPQTAGTYTEFFTPVIEKIRWMEDQELAFNFSVQNDDSSNVIVKKKTRMSNKVRVALNFKEQEEIILSPSSLANLYNGAVVLKKIPAKQKVTVKKHDASGKYLVTTGTVGLLVDGPVRMKTVSAIGYITIENLDRRPAWNKEINDNTFLEVIEVISEDSGLRPINELDIENYLKGLAEFADNELPEKMKAIIVAARSYAKYYTTQAQKFPGKPYHLDDDPANTQKYIGYGVTRRSPNIIKAVNDTKGEVVTYNGKLIKTPYFSSDDGRTRSGQEVFGWTNTPYLQGVEDPGCVGKKMAGHGVGMSGCGARYMAEQGKTYKEIMKYYYKGVEIGPQS